MRDLGTGGIWAEGLAWAKAQRGSGTASDEGRGADSRTGIFCPCPSVPGYLFGPSLSTRVSGCLENG